jgi:hypothetical protein
MQKIRLRTTESGRLGPRLVGSDVGVEVVGYIHIDVEESSPQDVLAAAREMMQAKCWGSNRVTMARQSSQAASVLYCGIRRASSHAPVGVLKDAAWTQGTRVHAQSQSLLGGVSG